LLQAMRSSWNSSAKNEAAAADAVAFAGAHATVRGAPCPWGAATDGSSAQSSVSSEARAVVRSAGLSVESASLQSRSPPPLLPTTAPTKAAKQTAGHILGTPNRQFEVKARTLLLISVTNSAFFFSMFDPVKVLPARRR